jgi:DNA polymerase-3 subunit beta
MNVKTEQSKTAVTTTVQQAALADALAKVRLAVRGTTTLPVLRCVLVELLPGKVRLTGTDLDLWVRCEVEADGPGDGKACVPLRLMQDAVAQSAGNLRIGVGRSCCVLQACSGVEWRLEGMDAGEFPPEPKFNAENVVKEAKWSALAEAVGRVRFACSSDESRYTLCGVLCGFKSFGEGGSVFAVATDARRIALFNAPRSRNDAVFQFILPCKAADAVLAVAGAGGVSVEAGGGFVLLRGTDGGTVLWAKTMDDIYPEWANVVPEKFEHSVKLDAAAAARLVRSVAVVGSEREGSVKVEVSAAAAVLSCGSSDNGSAKVSVPVSYAGPEKVLWFHWRYLAEMLEGAGPGEAVFAFNDVLEPGFVVAGGYKCVLMPMRM